MIRTVFLNSVFEMKDEAVKLAKAAAEEFVLWNKVPLVRAGFVICDEEHFRGMRLSDCVAGSKCGCYVCVRKDGVLRGCMGSLSAAENDFASEVIRNSVAAVCKDVRFKAVCAEELPFLEYSVFCVTDVVEVSFADWGGGGLRTDVGCANTGGGGAWDAGCANREPLGARDVGCAKTWGGGARDVDCAKNGLIGASDIDCANREPLGASGDDCDNTGVIVSAGCRQAIVLPFEDKGLSFANKIKEACIRGNISLDEKPLVKKIIFA